jgi:putative aldouronate transport system substrate-binding protein
MKRSIVFLLVLALLAPVMLFAAGSSEQKPPVQEIRVLSSVTGGKDEAENKLFEEALEKATGLSITLEKVPSGYDQVLLQKLGAGEQYDLIYLNQFQMYTFASQGAIADLTDRIETSAVYRDNVSPDELDKIRMNGKLYAGFNKLEVFPW